MKKLQPFFRGYWQTAVPFFIALTVLEFIKPGFVQSHVDMTAFFVTIFVVFILDNIASKSSSIQ